MLKKTFLLAFLLAIPAVSFASGNGNSTLTVTPYNPSTWGYQAATVTVSNHSPKVSDGVAISVGGGVTIPVSLNNKIVLTVYAMNAKPKLANSCQNIQIYSEGAHQLLFELKDDWFIHCRYS